jgi:hypothetical protein
MAINIQAGDPAGLFSAIKKAIDEKSIATWSYDGDGDFTHTPAQWDKRAWLRPSIETGQLNLMLIWPKGAEESKVVSGIYQGRFIEMLVDHFDKKFTKVSAAIP